MNQQKTTQLAPGLREAFSNLRAEIDLLIPNQTDAHLRLHEAVSEVSMFIAQGAGLVNVPVEDSTNV